MYNLSQMNRVCDEKKDESNKINRRHIVKNVLGTLKNGKNRLRKGR